MVDPALLIETYGLPGLIIFGLGWAYMAERKERKEAQQANLETLEKIIPLASALSRAVDNIERAR